MFLCSETISTLRFGTRAKFIKNKVRTHIGYSTSGVLANAEMTNVLMKREEEISRMQSEYSALENEISTLRSKNVRKP
jgi:hypothetical protein